jgi:hypothetical protein
MGWKRYGTGAEGPARTPCIFETVENAPKLAD